MEVPVFVSASQILARLKTVDANDSGLNANTLQGYVATDFALASALSGYLRTTGADVGASASVQTLTLGAKLPSLQPLADSTTALRVFKADGVTALATIDTTNNRLGWGIAPTHTVDIANNTASAELLRVGGESTFYWTFINAGATTSRVILRGIVASATAFQLDPLGTSYMTSGLVLGHNATVDGAMLGIRQSANNPIVAVESATGLDLMQLSTVGASDASKRALLALYNVGAIGISLNALTGSYINGTLSVGHNGAPTANGDFAASTTAAASLRLRSGVAPTSPNAGDMWTDGTDFYGRGAASYSWGATVRTTAIRPLADSTTALQLQNAAGTAVVTVNTTDRALIFPASANASAAFSGFEMAAPDGTKVASFQSIQDVGGSTLTFFSNNRKFGSGAWSVSGYPTNRPGITHYMRDEFWSLWTFAAGSASAIFLLNAGPTGVRINPGSGNDIAAATALMEIGASTTARASLRLRTGVAPTSPNDGDVWQDGTDLKIRIGGVTKTFTLV